MLRKLLLHSFGLFLMPACMAQKKSAPLPPVQALPSAHVARQFGYEVRQGAEATVVVVQVTQPAPEAFAMAINHQGVVYHAPLAPKVRSGSRQLIVQFPEDTAALISGALMFRLSDTLLRELMYAGHTQLELVRPYRVYEADGRAQMEREVLASLQIRVSGDTVLPVSLNGSAVLLSSRVAEGMTPSGRYCLYFSGDAGNPILLGWDFKSSVRLKWIEMADNEVNPLLLKQGSSLLFLYNHPVMYEGLWDYLDDSLWLYIERADSLLQGRYRLSGRGCYTRTGRFVYESGRGDDPTMRMIPEYSMEDCARFGLDCGNWFLRSAQWNALMYKALVRLEVNENKNAQWFSPLLNHEGNFAFSRRIRMHGAEQEIRVLRLKDRYSETVMDVLPNSDYPMVVYWQEGTESLELKAVYPPAGKRKR